MKLKPYQSNLAWGAAAVALYFAMPYITKFFMYVTRFGY